MYLIPLNSLRLSCKATQIPHTTAIKTNQLFNFMGASYPIVLMHEIIHQQLPARQISREP